MRWCMCTPWWPVWLTRSTKPTEVRSTYMYPEVSILMCKHNLARAPSGFATNLICLLGQPCIALLIISTK